MGASQQSGQQWEDRASEYLRLHGLQVLKRRYRCRLGELDLVCRDGSTLVIVEVRARARGAMTSALASIDRRKRRKIVQATRHLLMRHPQWQELAWRFDVFAIDGIDTEAPSFEWVKNAFDCS